MKHYAVLIIAVIGLFFEAEIRAQGVWLTDSSYEFAPRYGHSACMVGGKIYVVGGYDNTGNTPPIQIFDPVSHIWSAPVTTGTPYPYLITDEPTADVVDGKIYAIGWQAPLKIFDPATNAWSSPTLTGTYSIGWGHSSCVLDGKIYVFAGIIGHQSSNSVGIFDPSTNTWSTPVTTGTFTRRQDGLTSSVVNGKIYVMGGDADRIVSSVEVFDPSTNAWSTLTTTGTYTPRYRSTACVVEGKIYLIGGDTTLSGGSDIVEVFDPSTNRWSMPVSSGVLTARSALTSCLLDGKIHVMGGYQGPTNQPLNTNEVFSPSPPASLTEESPQQSNVVLSPNPTTGIVMFRQEGSFITHVSITNAVGEFLIDCSDASAGTVTIDLSKLPAGMYFARIAIGYQVITKKILKE